MAGLGSLQFLSDQPIALHRRPPTARRSQRTCSQLVYGSLARQLCLGAAAVTAVGLTAVSLRHMMQQRSLDLEQERRQQRRRAQDTDGGTVRSWQRLNGSSSSSSRSSGDSLFGSGHGLQLGLGWPLKNKEQQLQQTVRRRACSQLGASCALCNALHGACNPQRCNQGRHTLHSAQQSVTHMML